MVAPSEKLCEILNCTFMIEIKAVELRLAEAIQNCLEVFSCHPNPFTHALLEQIAKQRV